MCVVARQWNEEYYMWLFTTGILFILPQMKISHIPTVLEDSRASANKTIVLGIPFEFWGLKLAR